MDIENYQNYYESLRLIQDRKRNPNIPKVSHMIIDKMEEVSGNARNYVNMYFKNLENRPVFCSMRYPLRAIEDYYRGLLYGLSVTATNVTNMPGVFYSEYVSILNKNSPEKLNLGLEFYDSIENDVFVEKIRAEYPPIPDSSKNPKCDIVDIYGNSMSDVNVIVVDFNTYRQCIKDDPLSSIVVEFGRHLCRILEDFPYAKVVVMIQSSLVLHILRQIDENEKKEYPIDYMESADSLMDGKSHDLFTIVKNSLSYREKIENFLECVLGERDKNDTLLSIQENMYGELRDAFFNVIENNCDRDINLFEHTRQLVFNTNSVRQNIMIYYNSGIVNLSVPQINGENTRFFGLNAESIQYLINS